MHHGVAVSTPVPHLEVTCSKLSSKISCLDRGLSCIPESRWKMPEQ